MVEHIAVGDARIATQVSGQGPALLLLHGAEASRLMFHALVPLLSRSFTVIAYDQRDCGETESPPQPACLAVLADDAHGLVRALGWQRVHVFGTSFGGRVAQALALRHPGCVDRLALASTWPLPEALDALYPQGSAAIAALRARLPDSSAELASWFFPEAVLRQQPELRAVFAQARAADPRSQRRALAVASTLDDTVARLTMPTLLLAGACDRVVPPSITLGMGSLLPQARQVLLDQVGHATAMQAPQMLARHLTEFFLATAAGIAPARQAAFQPGENA